MCLTPVLPCCKSGQNQKAGLPQSGGSWSRASLSPRRRVGCILPEPFAPALRQPPPSVSFLQLGKFLLHPNYGHSRCSSVLPPRVSRFPGETGSTECPRQSIPVCGVLRNPGPKRCRGRKDGPHRAPEPGCRFPAQLSALGDANFSLCHYFRLHCLTTG